jgi:drug/metabolite transporter (DMT)-like permease
MMADSREAIYGPWLVALGAALWGTESAWRIPLNDIFSADVMVLWEHLILVAVFLPLIVPRLGELRSASRRAIGSLVLSGIAGSAVGTVFFTLALKHGNPTVVNVVLNIQPVVSTTLACLLFGDRLGRRFIPWAAFAVFAGALLVFTPAHLQDVHGGLFDRGTGYALVCALSWGLATVAGRGVMLELSLPLAAGLRLVIGLVAMTLIVGARGRLTPEALWPALASAEVGHAVLWLLLLAVLSGGIPLLLYFAGLRRTRASTAGYFEMMQTLAAVAITWGFFGAALAPHQVLAGILLIAAVAVVQRIQAGTAVMLGAPAPSAR